MDNDWKKRIISALLTGLLYSVLVFLGDRFFFGFSIHPLSILFQGLFFGIFFELTFPPLMKVLQQESETRDLVESDTSTEK